MFNASWQYFCSSLTITQIILGRTLKPGYLLFHKHFLPNQVVCVMIDIEGEKLRIKKISPMRVGGKTGKIFNTVQWIPYVLSAVCILTCSHPLLSWVKFLSQEILSRVNDYRAYGDFCRMGYLFHEI